LNFFDRRILALLSRRDLLGLLELGQGYLPRASLVLQLHSVIRSQKKVDLVVTNGGKVVEVLLKKIGRHLKVAKGLRAWRCFAHNMDDSALSYRGRRDLNQPR
jgi:hypothetical protein